MKNHLGTKIRTLRENEKLLLRQVASMLEMDTAQLSKIERGERQAKRGTIIQLAQVFKVDNNELLILWLADQIYDVVKDDENALEAIVLAEEKIEYLKSNKSNG
jgi:transcriptional regulator with XRE-family HTH domain